MKSYPKMPVEIIAWLRKRELERYRQSEQAVYAPEPSEPASPLVKEIEYVMEF